MTAATTSVRPGARPQARLRLEAASAIAASVVLPLGLILAGILVPSTVDRVSTSDAIGTAKVMATANHPARVRVGYLLLVTALLCVPAATRQVLRLAPTRGAALVEIGWRLVSIAAAAGAVGNAFAPLVLPSTVDFDPTLMGRFVHHHETSTASYAIIGVYLLLTIGAIVLLVGLLRAGTIPWWLAALLCVTLGVITPLRLGPQAIVDGMLLGVALLFLHRLAPTNE